MRLGLKRLILFLFFAPVIFYGEIQAANRFVYYPSINPTLTGPDTACSGQGGYSYCTEAGMNNYVWTVSSGGTINLGSGTHCITVTWNTPGPDTVTVTYENASAPAVKYVTVLQTLPAGITVSPSLTLVCAGDPVTFTATVTNGGSSPFYQWRVNNINVGANSSTYTYNPTDKDTVICVFTSSQLCTTGNPASSIPIILDVTAILPVSVSVFASGNPVCNGTLVTFTAIALNPGTSPVYHWKVNGALQATIISTFSYIPANGDVVTCELISNVTCPSANPAISNPVTMTVSPDQPVSVSIAASVNPVCLGSTVSITATPVNGGSLPVFEWKINGVVYPFYTGAVLTYTPTNGDIILCKLTSNAPCATGNPALSNTIILNVNAYAPVSVIITASANPVCSGIPVIFTATPANGGTNPSYQWKINGSPVPGNSPAFTYTPNNGDIITCELTSNIPCPDGNPALSNTIIMTVSPNLPASVSISVTANPDCQGTPVTFTATPTNGGTYPSYQWKVNGVNMGTNDPTFTYTPLNGDIVICIMNSNDPCNMGIPVQSNTINMSVSPGLAVGVSIVASVNPVCQGSNVTFTATPVNGGPNPIYQWTVNGVNAGTNQNTYAYIPLNNDVVICTLTSSMSCATGNPATSNAITLTVSTNLPVSVTITASPDPSCAGQTVTFTATVINGGTNPSYQWYVNGIIMGTNQDTFSYIPANGDCIVCDVVSGYSCATGNPAVSNQICVTVNPNLPASVTITSSQNPSCVGSTICYTATPVNGGPSPSYQWKVNNLNVGASQNTFCYVPVTGDIIKCILTSSIPCPITNPVTSNSIPQVVNPILNVSVNIVASPSGAVCTGTSVTFTATAFNGGPAPTFQWKVNGLNAGSNSSSLIFTPNNGDIICCVLTSSYQCASGNPATSNCITMVVSSSLLANINIFANSLNPPNPFCQGTWVHFTSIISNGGSLPQYQWMVNGNPSCTTSACDFVPADGDYITCKMTSSLWCATPNPATSSPIIMKADTTTTARVSVVASENPVCPGSTVTFTATPVNGGTTPQYQWSVNGTAVGLSSPTYTCTPTNGDIVRCALTSNAVCVYGNPAMSNPITMNIPSLLTASISITASSNPFCQGTSVTYTATATNKGSSPVYQWYKNSFPVGSNLPTYTCSPITGDIIYCSLTSNSTCLTGSNPFVSNSITMVSSTALPVSVSIAASGNPVCQGSAVTYTATPVNGGPLPVYHWFVGAIPTGTTTNTLICTPANGNVITCHLTSSLSCATGNPATSNSITMSMTPPSPVSISIAAFHNPTCLGAVDTFYASPVNGGSAPFYIWRVNGINQNVNNPKYYYIPLNGDIITCELISNQNCISGNPAMSNQIRIVVGTEQPVTVSITASANPFCVGNCIIFTAHWTNGGQDPLAVWRKNGIIINSGDSLYSITDCPIAGDTYTCQVTSNAACICNNPATSNTIVMVASSGLPVHDTITMFQGSNPMCSGQQTIFMVTYTNGGSSPTIQWKVNGIPAGSNSSYFNCVPVPVNGDVITCTVTSNLSCATGNPATSNSITMNVIPLAPVSIHIDVSPDPSCTGGAVTCTATPVNGGDNPVYQWKVNNLNKGGNSPTYTYVPVAGDSVQCRLTSNATCRTGNPALSNVVHLTILPYQNVSVSILPSANPVCQGTSVTYTATPVNGGPSPTYQWKVNGIIITGATNSTYSYIPLNGDVVSCVVTSNAQCVLLNTATSNFITMIVSPYLPVSVLIAASLNPVCQGSPVTFTATPVNGGSGPEYLWKVNGIISGTNNASFTYIPVNGDIVTCVMTSHTSCPTGNPATSNAIVMNVSNSLPVSDSITASSNPACQGQTITYTSYPVNGGTNPYYQWLVKGVPVGAHTSSYSYIPSTGDIVCCQVTSDLLCTTGNPAMSNCIAVVFYPDVSVSVTITSSANPTCLGNPVTFTATPANGGTAPAYQWKVNGINVGGNSQTYTYVPNNGDIISCVLTSNIPCPINNPATSNTITMMVQNPVPASVSITASANPVCLGTAVTYLATPVNGGPSPVYHWYVNGSTTGAVTNSLTYAPADNDIITCSLTSNLSCVSGSPAMSNPVTMGVFTEFPVSVSVISSANPVCQGLPVTYTAIPVNGGLTPVYQWQVNGMNVGANNPSFSYIPTNGDLITCTLTSSYSCATGNPAVSNTIIMTVIPYVPASVSITCSKNPECTGFPVTFTATPTNGGSSPIYQWRVNGLNVGLPSGNNTYTYTPINGDVVSCILTSSLPCVSSNPAVSNPITMTIGSAFPVSVSISANPSGAVCEQTTVYFTATPEYGGSVQVYQWIKNGVDTGSNSRFFHYIPHENDVITCVMNSNLSCGTNNPATSNPLVMTVLPVPVSVTITADPTDSICENDWVTYTAHPINGGPGPTYMWRLSNSTLTNWPVGTNQQTFSYQPQYGDTIYCIICSNATCAIGNLATSNKIVIRVDPILPVSISISATATTVCAGTSVTYTAAIIHGGPAPLYQWKVDGVLAGSNSPVFTYVPSNGDIVTCVLTSNARCPSGNPATSNAITMTVHPNLPVNVSITASQNTICAGTSVTYTATQTNGGPAPFYQWIVNEAAVGTNSPTYSYTPFNGDLVKCILTSNAICPTGNPDTSNAIIMLVNPILPVSVSILANPSDTVCAGIPVTFTATPTNGGSSPAFQWKVNGVNVGISGPSYTYIPSGGDVVCCILNSSAPCTTGNPAISNCLSMTVYPNLPVSISISDLPSGPVCEGTSVCFSATSVNGGLHPLFQWKVNGIIVGTDTNVFCYVPVNGDIIFCVLTSGAICRTGNPATSNSITMTVNPNMPVSVSVTASPSDTVCPGVPVTYTATAVNGGSSPVFQWKVNGVIVGGNNPVYTYIPFDGDVISCTLTSNITCPTGNPATSNIIVMKVRANMPVSVVINPDPAGPVCAGTQVCFTAAPTNGGSNPFYQWKLNGGNTGSDSPTYCCFPVNGDVISCVLTSDTVCALGNPALSNIITMTVNPNLPVSVVINANPPGPVCSGDSVLFTANPINEGSLPQYQWKVNGNNMGMDSRFYKYSPLNGDVISCVLISNATCATGNPASSNTIAMTINPLLPVSIAVTATSPDTVCAGTLVCYTATGINGGPNPVYQWKVNGIDSGSNSPSYCYHPVNGDIITCQLTSDAICATGSPATSNMITMTVNPLLPASVSISASPAGPICAGTMVTFKAHPVNGGTPLYQWYNLVTPIAGETDSTYATPSLVNGDQIYVVMTSTATCATGSPATSNMIPITVNPLLPAAVTISAIPPGPVCAGTSVTFTAIPVNGGVPAYQWFTGAIPIAGETGPTYTSATLVNGEQISVVMTSTATCATGSPATSNMIPMTVNPLLPAVVTISAVPPGPICAGTSVTFTAIPFNGGVPAYQWFTGATPIAGETGPTYTSATLVNGEQISVVMTSTATCATGSPATSNMIPMTVNPLLPAAVTISAIPPGPVCAGTSVTFTAIPVNGGVPAYQWFTGAVAIAGETGPTYTSATLVNGEQISVVMTSTATCATGSPATSNLIPMTVNPLLPAAVTISALPPGPVCAGTSVTFTAIPVNGGVPAYQWFTGAIPIAGETGPTYTSATLVNGEQISVVMTSTATCATGSPATSNMIPMTVNPLLPAVVTISAVPPGPICAGTSVTFTAIPVNGGIPAYQWFTGAVAIAGETGPTYTSATLVNGEQISVVMTSTAICATGSPATSNMIPITVNPLLPAAVSISAVPPGPVCAGTSVTFTAIPVNGGVPAYQWFTGAVAIAGETGPTYTSATLVNGEQISVVMTSTATCATGSPATSNMIPMTVNPNLPVSIAITAAPGMTVCEGTSVCYLATVINGGSSPVFVWKVNGVVVGGNLPTYSYTPVNGDIITCEITSNAICATGNPAVSNNIVMTVYPNLTVSVSISSNAPATVCAGDQVCFTATPVNAGPSPLYQWKVNSISAGSNSQTFCYPPANGDTVSCILTSNAICAIGNPATSNAIAMVVNPLMPVSVTISANPSGAFCAGTSVTYNAAILNGGAGPVYQWKINSHDTGTNNPVFSYVPKDDDLVTCVLTSNITCPVNNPATSNPLMMSVHSIPYTSLNMCLTLTSRDGKPFVLRGGIPTGGVYSGPGVNNGLFYPNMIPVGQDSAMITYTNTSASGCTSSGSQYIVVMPSQPFVCGNNFIDIRDNRSYPTAALGTQCWFTKNLNYGVKVNASQVQRDNCIKEKYCYSDDSLNCTAFGGLYQWDEVMQYDNVENAQGFCPPGWHIPSEPEWNLLFALFNTNSHAGDSLKLATISSFQGRLGGGHFNNSGWKFKDFSGFYWSSTPDGALKGWAHGINNPNHGVSSYPSLRSNAFSIRCIKD